MNSIHRSSLFSQPRSQHMLPDGHRPSTPTWHGARHPSVDGRQDRARAASPRSLLAMADECNGRMARDPDNAPHIYDSFLQQVHQLLPHSPERLRSMPMVSSTQALQRQVHRAGRELGRQARAQGRAPILIQGAQRGSKNETAAFNASLLAARAAGISQLVIEQPEGMSQLDAMLGGPVVQLIREGRPSELKKMLIHNGVPHNRNIESLINCAKNVCAARQQGLQVSFLDLAHSRGMSSDARNEAMAMALSGIAESGEGVMADIAALCVGDVASVAGLTGAPIRAMSFISDGPEAALCLGHYDETGASRLPNFSVLRLPNERLAGQGAGQPQRRPQPGFQGPQQHGFAGQSPPSPRFHGQQPHGWPGQQAMGPARPAHGVAMRPHPLESLFQQSRREVSGAGFAPQGRMGMQPWPEMG